MIPPTSGEPSDRRPPDRRPPVTAAPGRRRGRARHAAPVAVGRGVVLTRTLAWLVLTVAGVLVAVVPPGGAGVRVVPPGRVVAGVVLIVAGAVPVADLLIRRRHELRAVAGPRPARTAPAAAVLGPVVTVAGCLWYRQRPPGIAGPSAPVLVSGVLLAVLVVAQVWGLGGLWRRPAPGEELGSTGTGTGGGGTGGSSTGGSSTGGRSTGGGGGDGGG